MAVSLVSIEIENLRGFDKIYLPLDQSRILLVGKNNSGKTSVIKILDWIFNKLDLDAIEKEESSPENEQILLMPSKSGKKRARRVRLGISIDDARRHRRFQCDNGIAILRLTIRQTPKPQIIPKLGNPRRNESTTPDRNAIALLRELRENTAFIYVPAFRDASSERFSDTLNQALRAKIAQRALHARQGGAPSEYREVRAVMGRMGEVAEGLAAPLWGVMQTHLPFGLARDCSINFDCASEDLVSWMVDRLFMRVSTNERDGNGVFPHELGSGLQSLMDFTIQMSQDWPEDIEIIVALEEPEAFLHPSAQRTFARLLFDDASIKKMIITTHSPIIVEEAKYGEVILMQDHNVFLPSVYEDERRNEINTSLTTKYGAELMFSSGVMLVEGEGDREFFEEMRRRIAANSQDGRVDDLIVVPVGSKTSFSPWIQLLQSYRKGDKHPIKWLIVSDGDAAGDIRLAFKYSKYKIPQEIISCFSSIKQATDNVQWAERIRVLNMLCEQHDFPLRMMPIDLESAILQEANDDLIINIAGKVGWDDLKGNPNKAEVIKRLGSKMAQNRSEKWKAPWIRGYIGKEIPWDMVSTDIRNILVAWLKTVMDDEEARNILTRME